MKVKISYSMDLEDIPREVNKLLVPRLAKLEDMLKDSRFNVTKDTVDLSILNLQYLRDVLLEVDTRVAECYSILQGYKEALIEQPEEEKDEPLPK